MPIYISSDIMIRRCKSSKLNLSDMPSEAPMEQRVWSDFAYTDTTKIRTSSRMSEVSLVCLVLHYIRNLLISKSSAFKFITCPKLLLVTSAAASITKKIGSNREIEAIGTIPSLLVLRSRYRTPAWARSRCTSRNSYISSGSQTCASPWFSCILFPSWT